MSVKVSTIIDQIDLGQIAMPKFQRPYVWNRDQVRNLIKSMYLGHPVGSLLFWNTLTEVATGNVKGQAQLASGAVKLLLDGQQRITTLYGVIKGAEPPFFEGDAHAFTNLYFNVESEEFEFYAMQKMNTNPLWVSVTELMQKDVGDFWDRFPNTPEGRPPKDYITRLNRLHRIKEKELNYEEVDSTKTVTEVVDIFNKVNSGGTKLSKGDLALAKICASWPAARDQLRQRLAKWQKAGFEFELDWLLRCVNAIVTGEALFDKLDQVTVEDFRQGLEQAEKSVDFLLNLLSSRLGLDHDRVLGSRYSFPVLSRYLVDRKGKLEDHQEVDKLLYWYINTLLWGRFTGSTETVINQDLHAIEEPSGAMERLIAQLRQNRGDLQLRSADFGGWGLGSRFYPMLYMMSRVRKTRDLGSGLELSAFLLGYQSSLQVHHIFPKALLYRHNYSKSQVNAIANLTFLTQQTNVAISDKDPANYLPVYAAKHPGALESHWIPTDPELWKIENYEAFLAKRRELLAATANEFLNELLNGKAVEKPIGDEVLNLSSSTRVAAVEDADSVENEAEEKVLAESVEWVKNQRLPAGSRYYQLTDDNGQQLAVLDIAWPRGLQLDLSEPVALLIDEPQEVKDIAQQKGFRYYTSLEAFKEYVEQEILALA